MEHWHLISSIWEMFDFWKCKIPWSLSQDIHQMDNTVKSCLSTDTGLDALDINIAGVKIRDFWQASDFIML